MILEVLYGMQRENTIRWRWTDTAQLEFTRAPRRSQSIRDSLMTSRISLSILRTRKRARFLRARIFSRRIGRCFMWRRIHLNWERLIQRQICVSRCYAHPNVSLEIFLTCSPAKHLRSRSPMMMAMFFRRSLFMSTYVIPLGVGQDLHCPISITNLSPRQRSNVFQTESL